MRAIVTREFTLEPQVVAHAEEMFRVLADPAIYEYENEPPASIDWLRDRFRKLETRVSPDASEEWLNWVIRLPKSQLAGYVQATVHADGHAAIAYVLDSAHWGRGLAGRAVQAMLDELGERHEVRRFTAVFKRENLRSIRLLKRLGFHFPSLQNAVMPGIEPGEWWMEKPSQGIAP